MTWKIFISIISLMFLIDIYVFQGLKILIRKHSWQLRKIIYSIFWSFPVYFVASFLFYKTIGPQAFHPLLIRWTTVFFFIIYISKLPALAFLLTDDFLRFGKWVVVRLKQGKVSLTGEKIPRSEFLAKASIVVAAIPAATLGFGILSGSYDYRVRRKQIVIPGLPRAFHGIRLGQLSDIHSGSFFNKKAVEGGVDLMLQEKPDIFVFTGDLVNNETEEVKAYKSMFSKLSAPLGAFSITGNHDYGDYRRWPSASAKKKNFENLIRVHKEMGWDILMNEHRVITIDGQQMAIIGIENWGTGRFTKYGDLSKAYQGSQDVPVKILLSHDPSHWDAQVRPKYTDIDFMLAGHTHGFQFGIEIGDFRWSPSQYIYKQWADLYLEGNQKLYVNRGFGFIGYPGRVGILPEVTILELVSA